MAALSKSFKISWDSNHSLDLHTKNNVQFVVTLYPYFFCRFPFSNNVQHHLKLKDMHFTISKSKATHIHKAILIN